MSGLRIQGSLQHPMIAVWGIFRLNCLHAADGSRQMVFGFKVPQNLPPPPPAPIMVPNKHFAKSVALRVTSSPFRLAGKFGNPKVDANARYACYI